jgi:hypothetical protein
MKNRYRSCIALVLALASAGAFAADLTADQQAELRERASALNAERQRNPEWDGGQRRVSDVKLNDNRGEVKNPSRGDVKPRPHSGKPATKTQRAQEKVKRSAKKIPGALVR